MANEMFEIKDSVLVKYLGNDAEVVIPDGVKSIGDWAFFGCSSLTSITLPRDITTIGESMFFGCYRLEKINIPAKVKTIEKRAF